MKSRLDRVLAKLERAEYHIRDFKSVCAEFIKSDAYKLVAENDPKRLQRIYKVVPKQRLPEKLSLIAGDAIHNLRSALDHMVCQLVLANGEQISGTTSFPIHQIAPRDEMRRSAKIAGVPSAAIDLIEAQQPYVTGCNDLWILHKLDIDDKHRLLLIVTIGNLSATVTISDGNHNSASIGFAHQFSGVFVFFSLNQKSPSRFIMANEQPKLPSNGNPNTKILYDVLLSVLKSQTVQIWLLSTAIGSGSFFYVNLRPVLQTEQGAAILSAAIGFLLTMNFFGSIQWWRENQLVLHYGMLWDSRLNAYCAKCRIPLHSLDDRDDQTSSRLIGPHASFLCPNCGPQFLHLDNPHAWPTIEEVRSEIRSLR